MKFFNTYLSNKLSTLIFLCLSIGCESFVDIPLSNTELTSSLVFEDAATAQAAMTGVYASIREKGLLTGKISGLSHQLGLYSDELTYFGPSLNLSLDFYQNTLSTSDIDLESLWKDTYQQIYMVNAVLQGTENTLSLSKEDKDGLMGEALFVRALLHFYLVNLYGDIPYVTSIDYMKNSKVARISMDDIYRLIIKDINAAITLLPADYRTTERVRPNKATAQAMLARLFLYTESWQEASDMASVVVNQTGLYSLQDDLENTFLKSSSSTIWQLSPSQKGYNTHEGSTFLFTSGPPPLSALSEDLMSAFSQDDLRKKYWIGDVTDGTVIWYHPAKYKRKLFEGSAEEYSKIFRLAEVYLIRAEARAQIGDLIGATKDLNKIRSRAGLVNIPVLIKEEIVQAIWRERRLELFGEHGHRFFDLKRSRQIDQVLSFTKPGWDSSDGLLPLPESELVLNPNLKPQNPGY